MDLNRVILIGRLANDPELKYTPSGIAVTSFRLAVNRPMSAEARQGGQEKQADFISVVAWRQSAEYAAQWLSKGRLIAVEGRLQVREYVTQDGQKRRDTEVVADNLKSLDRPKEGEEGASGGQGGGYSRAPAGGGGGYNGGGGGRGGGDYADADPSGDTGYGDEAPASPPPARAPARPAAAPARPAANNAPARPAGRQQAPVDEDLDDPFADN